MKTCSMCREEKDKTEFHANRAKKDGLQSHCRACQKLINAENYRVNPDKVKATTAARNAVVTAVNREYINNHLRTHPCVDCGETDIVVLDFDHVRGTKKYNISMMLGHNIDVLKAEIAKCDIRCANCHRRRHYK